MTEPRLVGERYELGALLGYGGMAEVHLGRDIRLGRQVAIKILRSDLARDPSFQTRFRREAQAAGGLNHPNIVAVYDTGEDRTPEGDIPYIVMEYVDGRTLRDVLGMEGRLEPARAMEIVAEICAALDFSHRHGIVHRDIKPANVMITRSGTAKVMDFGIARAVADGNATVTQTAAVIGTAQYLSPEQARGETVDARSDVYSTGCLLYELVVGHPPFRGDSPVAVAYQHVRETAPTPSSIVPTVPRALDSIVMKAMAKNALNRYQTAGEMRSDLLQAAADRPVAAERVMTDDERTQMIAATGPTAADRPRRDRDAALIAMDDEREDTGSRRGAVLWTAAIVVLLLVIGVGAYALLHGGNSKQATPTQPTTTSVPDLSGLTSDQAAAKINDAGLRLAGTPTQTNDNSQCPSAKATTVCTQDPEPDSSVNLKTPVTLTIYAGPKMVAVPYLVEQSLSDAQAALTRLGLIPAPKPVASNQPARTITKQTPDSGTSVAVGTKVTIYYSTGTLAIPDVSGMSETAARAKLNQAGFTMIADGHGTDPNTDSTRGYKVSRTDPAAGSVVDPSKTTLKIYLWAVPAKTCTSAPSSPSAPRTGTGTSTGTPTGTGIPTAPSGTGLPTGTGTTTGTGLPAC